MPEAADELYHADRCQHKIYLNILLNKNLNAKTVIVNKSLKANAEKINIGLNILKCVSENATGPHL